MLARARRWLLSAHLAGVQILLEFWHETMKVGQQAETPAQWAAFMRKYRAEMSTPEAGHLLELLAVLSRDNNFSVGCYCEDELHCHRSVLRSLLAEKGANIA